MLRQSVNWTHNLSLSKLWFSKVSMCFVGINSIYFIPFSPYLMMYFLNWSIKGHLLNAFWWNVPLGPYRPHIWMRLLICRWHYEQFQRKCNARLIHIKYIKGRQIHTLKNSQLTDIKHMHHQWTLPLNFNKFVSYTEYNL